MGGPCLAGFTFEGEQGVVSPGAMGRCAVPVSWQLHGERSLMSCALKKSDECSNSSHRWRLTTHPKSSEMLNATSHAVPVKHMFIPE